MDTLFLRMLVVASVVSALLAALLFPLRPWLERRYAPQTRLGVWHSMAALLLAGGLVAGSFAPPQTTITVPERMVSVPDIQLESPLSREPEPEPALPASAPVPAAPVASQATVPAAGLPEAVKTPEAARVSVPLTAVFGAVWLSVAAALFAGQYIRYFLTRRKLIKDSAPTEEFDALAAELRVQAAVRRLPGLDSPMTLGSLRPVVFLPEGDVDVLAVRHELTHILRQDLPLKELLFWACALYWFDPLVWYMARVAGRDMEAACDAQVTADMDAAGKRAYGELLLSAGLGRRAPLSTQFGGGKEQMKARLSQLFRTGKSSKVLVGIVAASAFLAAGMVACKSAGLPAVSDGTYYALHDESGQPGDAGFSEVVLELMDCVPAAGWVGDAYDTVTLPTAETVILDDRFVEKDSEEWAEQMGTFLSRPGSKPAFHMYDMDIIQVVVKDGEIAAMDWLDGMCYVGGWLWQDELHRNGRTPYVLRLPESMRTGAEAREVSLVTDAQGRVTQSKVVFYQKGVTGPEGLLVTIRGVDEDRFWAEHPTVAINDALGLYIPLGTGGGLLYYAEYPDFAYADRPEAYNLLSTELHDSLDPEDFRYLGGEVYGDCIYTNEQYGFSLALPESWKGGYEVRDIGGQLAFYRKGEKLERLFRVTRDPLSILEEYKTENDPTGYGEMTTELVWVLGEGGGYFYRIIMDPEDLWFADDDHSAEAEAYRVMNQEAWAIKVSDFRYLGALTYTNARYGFTLALPESWRDRWKAEESENGVEFYYQPPTFYYTEGTELLFTVLFRREPIPEWGPAGGTLMGRGNGVYLYSALPQRIPAPLFRHEEDAEEYGRMYEDLQRMEADGWTLTFTQANSSVPLPAVALDPAARVAFIGVLSDLYGLRLPDGTEIPWELRDSAAGSRFTVADVDGDGKEELVLLYDPGIMAGMTGYVIGYDRDKDDTYIQLQEFPSLHFYTNGVIQADASHNQGLGELWPYTLYQYIPGADSYEEVGFVDSWNKAAHPTGYDGQPYPEAIDKSGSGTVYYINGWAYGNESAPLDVTDYLNWRNQYVYGQSELALDYRTASRENIAALANPGTPNPKAESSGAGGVSYGGNGEVIPLADLEEGFGASSYFPGFTFTEEPRRKDAEVPFTGSIPHDEVCYKLTHDGGDFTVWVNGAETTMQVESASGDFMECDIPRFLPEILAYGTSLDVLDVTGDGVEDLVFLAHEGAPGALSTCCRVFDIAQRTIYHLSDLDTPRYAADLLSLVAVEGAVVDQTAEGPVAWCRISLAEQQPQGARVRLPEGVTIGTCDFSVPLDTAWFDLRAESGGLIAEAGFTIESAYSGDYLGFVTAPLRFDQGARRFSPEAARLSVSYPAALPDIPAG